MPIKKDLQELLHEKDRENKILKDISRAVSLSPNIDEILKRIIDVIDKITDCDSCFIYLIDQEKKELFLKASKIPRTKIMDTIRLKIGEGITGWVAKEKTPVAVKKDAYKDPRFKFFYSLPEDRYHAIISVPIINKGDVTGVINVMHKAPHDYKEDTISLLVFIADQIAGQVENARLYDEMKQRTKEIEAFAKISDTVVSNKYLDEILGFIVNITAEITGSKICSIMLLDDKKQELIIKSTQAVSKEYKNKSNIQVGHSIAGRVVSGKKPVAILDVKKEEAYMFPDIAKKEGLCSMLSVPMMVKDNVIGVVSSYTCQEQVFTERDINILQSIANQVAIVIENTKLMEETVTAKQALETRKLVERAKGILIERFGMKEDEAYKLIHKKSMNTRRTMKEVAEAVILSLDNEMK